MAGFYRCSPIYNASGQQTSGELDSNYAVRYDMSPVYYATNMISNLYGGGSSSYIPGSVNAQLYNGNITVYGNNVNNFYIPFQGFSNFNSNILIKTNFNQVTSNQFNIRELYPTPNYNLDINMAFSVNNLIKPNAYIGIEKIININSAPNFNKPVSLSFNGFDGVYISDLLSYVSGHKFKSEIKISAENCNILSVYGCLIGTKTWNANRGVINENSHNYNRNVYINTDENVEISLYRCFSDVNFPNIVFNSGKKKIFRLDTPFQAYGTTKPRPNFSLQNNTFKLPPLVSNGNPYLQINGLFYTGLVNYNEYTGSEVSTTWNLYPSNIYIPSETNYAHNCFYRYWGNASNYANNVDTLRIYFNNGTRSYYLNNQRFSNFFTNENAIYPLATYMYAGKNIFIYVPDTVSVSDNVFNLKSDQSAFYNFFGSYTISKFAYNEKIPVYDGQKLIGYKLNFNTTRIYGSSYYPNIYLLNNYHCTEQE